MTYQPRGTNPNLPQPNRSCVNYMADLRQQFDAEMAKLVPVYDPTDEEIMEGAVVIDSRNFSSRGTIFSMSRKGYLTKFGDPVQGVQYWVLTKTGLAAIRNLSA